MNKTNRISRKARFEYRFANGVHGVFDTLTYRTVATRGLLKDAHAEVSRRNANPR